MTINYVEKGYGLHLAIEKAGFRLFNDDGKYVTNPEDQADAKNDAAVQAIIDSYDPLPYAKEQAALKIQAAGLTSVQAIFPGIESWDLVNLIAQVVLSISPASMPLTFPAVSQIVAIYSAVFNQTIAVNTAIKEADVDTATALAVQAVAAVL